MFHYFNVKCFFLQFYMLRLYVVLKQNVLNFFEKLFSELTVSPGCFAFYFLKTKVIRPC